MSNRVCSDKPLERFDAMIVEENPDFTECPECWYRTFDYITWECVRCGYRVFPVLPPEGEDFRRPGGRPVMEV